uniref:ACB domain-containing protein n=1 Tax=Caenorhabditis japonica TaxID=281687 RepID=A0A8R1DZT9_CAEJA
MSDENHVRLSEAQLAHSEFGHPLEDCYKFAVQYYKKEHVGKQEPVPYDNRIKLLALSKQIQHGPFTNENDNAGWLDITGNDVKAKCSIKNGSLPRHNGMAANRQEYGQF